MSKRTTEAPASQPTVYSTATLRKALLAKRARLRLQIQSHQLQGIKNQIANAKRDLALALEAMASHKARKLADFDINNYNIEPINKAIIELDALGTPTIPAAEAREFLSHCTDPID